MTRNEKSKIQRELKRNRLRDSTELDAWHNDTNTVNGQMIRDRRATRELSYREDRRQAATNEGWQNRDTSAQKSTVKDRRPLHAQQKAAKQAKQKRLEAQKINKRNRLRDSTEFDSWMRSNDSTVRGQTFKDDSARRERTSQRLAKNTPKDSATRRDTSAYNTRKDEKHRETIHKIRQILKQNANRR